MDMDNDVPYTLEDGDIFTLLVDEVIPVPFSHF
jgi:hypothetical protein